MTMRLLKGARHCGLVDFLLQQHSFSFSLVTDLNITQPSDIYLMIISLCLECSKLEEIRYYPETLNLQMRT